MRFAPIFILFPKILCQWAFEGVPTAIQTPSGVLSAILSFKSGLLLSCGCLVMARHALNGL